MTDNFITVKTFTYPHELAILRSRLESEGIECFVKDELTIETYPFYSNALGGLKLQVKQSDLKKTIQILKETGYLNEEIISGPSEMNNKIDSVTSKVPFLNKLRFEFRLIFIIMVIISLLGGIIYWAILPSTLERLIANNWCVDKVFYDSTNFQPNTVEKIQLQFEGVCTETLELNYNMRSIKLPGFNSSQITGAWKYENNRVQIIFTDNYEFVYKGNYKIKFSNNDLILISSKTTIYCHKQEQIRF